MDSDSKHLITAHNLLNITDEESAQVKVSGGWESY